MTFTVGKYLNCIIKKPVHNKKTCTRVNTIQYNTIQYNTIHTLGYQRFTGGLAEAWFD